MQAFWFHTISMDDVKCLEHPTLKVPYEHLNKKFRAYNKTLEKDTKEMKDVCEGAQSRLRSGDLSMDELRSMFDGVVSKLTSFKRKADESFEVEEGCIHKCKIRLDHLKQHLPVSRTVPDPVKENVWLRQREDRMLVDHCLRSGYYETAILLAKDSEIEDFVDIALFQNLRRIEEGLLSHNVQPCLQWCHENQNKLKKIKSTLEFSVRMQEFVELIKTNKRLEAIRYSRKHFSNVEAHLFDDMRQGMALLAFQPTTKCKRYMGLFDSSRWESLIQQFRADNFALHQLNGQSVLSVVLQTGLSAMKTHRCFQEEHKNTNCPVCQPPFNELAKTLPYQHCSVSRLVCRITGKAMGDNNPPVVLPNGYVYSREALQDMAAVNDGVITCPRSKEQFSLDKAQKLFVM